MKKTAFLMGMSLVVFFLSGLTKEVYGQWPVCCGDGYMSEPSYRWENDICQQVHTCDRMGNQCTPSCGNMLIAMACISNGNIWHGFPSCYCESSACNSSDVEYCASIGRDLEPSNCQCTSFCSPSLSYMCQVKGGSFDGNCECIYSSGDPCANPIVGSVGTSVYYQPPLITCHSCGIGCHISPGGTDTYIYIGTDGSTCYEDPVPNPGGEVCYTYGPCYHPLYCGGVYGICGV